MNALRIKGLPSIVEQIIGYADEARRRVKERAAGGYGHGRSLGVNRRPYRVEKATSEIVEFLKSSGPNGARSKEIMTALPDIARSTARTALMILVAREEVLASRPNRNGWITWRAAP